MAKFQDTVEILIQARDEARRELQGIRQEVAKTRDELGGKAGVVANAAKLHHALQKVSAATDGIKTGMAAIRGIAQGLDGDSEGMVESFKQLGFGIGEVVNQADQLFDLLANKIYGVTEELLELEQKQNAEHAGRVRLQRQQNANAEKARLVLNKQLRDQSIEIGLLEAATDQEKEQIQANERLTQARHRAYELLATGEKDISKLNRERVKSLVNQVLINATLIEQRKAEINEEKRKTEELKKQQQILEQQRETERAFIQSTMERLRSFATDALKGQLQKLRDEASAIAARGATISLGQQSGRFATGLRDQQASREDPMIQEQRKLRESFDRKIEDLARQIKEMNKRISGGNIRLIPLTFNAGASL